MVNRKPCQPCRNRKIKCDGLFPECSTCKGRGKNVHCKYDDCSIIESGQVPMRSVKGQSCLPCRKKKKRCTSTRPWCEECETSGIQRQCTYPPSVLTHDHARESTHLRKLKPMSQESASETTAVASSSTSSVLPSRQNSRNTRMLPSIRELMSSIASSPSYARRPPAPFAHFRPMLNLKPHLRIPLLLADDPRAFAVSEVSQDDMNMNFRLAFLDRRLQLGFYISWEKAQAIVRGDISNAVIHPFFIHFAHAIGCQMYQERRGDFTYLYLIGLNMQMAWEAVAGMREEDDPFLLAQTYHYLFFGFMHSNNLIPAKRFLRRSAGIVKRYNIRFVPISNSDAAAHSSHVVSSIPPFSDEIWERAVLLAKLVYSDIHLHLVTGHFENVCTDLETQFRMELPIAYPVLFDICPVIMRVRSVLLVKDANGIIAAHKQQINNIWDLWIARCETMLDSLSKHIDHLSSRMVAFSSDHDSSLSVRYSMIICFTTKAELCRLLTRTTSMSSTGSQYYHNQCEDSLRCVVELTQGLDQEDFNFLDPFLGICWTRAISLLLDYKTYLPLPSTSDERQVDTRVIIITQSKEKLDVTIAGPPVSCEWLAEANFKRKPGVPNYLLDDVRIAWGL